MRSARYYRTLVGMPSLLSSCYNYCTLVGMPSLLCHLYYATFITLSLYIVGSIAFGRRGRCYTRYRCHTTIIRTTINVLARSS